MFVNADNGGTRLQGSGEPALRPTPSTQEITDKLSGLFVGQRLLAEIQSVMPNGTYRALINQRNVTLALPFTAKTGDAIELAVTASDGKLTLAVVAQGAAGNSAANPSAAIHLSQTGQLIHDLLGGSRQGTNVPSALPLNGNRPIAEQPPRNGQDLSPLLQQAIRQSGMFYESHQAEWVAGRLALSELAHEPQARLTGRTGGVGDGTPVEAPFEKMPGNQDGTLSDDHSGNRIRTQAETRRDTQPGTQAGMSPGEVARQSTLSMTASTEVTNPKGAVTSPSAGGDRQPGSESLPTTVKTPAAGPEASSASVPSTTSSLAFEEELSARAAVIAGSRAPVDPKTEDPLLNMGTGAQASEPPDSAESAASPETAVNRFHPAGHRQSPPTTLTTADHLIASLDPRSDSQAATGGEALLANQNQPNVQGDRSAVSAAMPPAVQAIVQQQLEAFATQHFSWQGQIWPGQQMHWEIEDHSQRRDADGTPGDGSEKWQTRLRLILPKLGEIDARLQISDQQATLTLLVDNAKTREMLRGQGADLHRHLANAGLTLAALGVIQSPS